MRKLYIVCIALIVLSYVLSCMFVGAVVLPELRAATDNSSHSPFYEHVLRTTPAAIGAVLLALTCAIISIYGVVRLEKKALWVPLVIMSFFSLVTVSSAAMMLMFR